MFPSEIFLLIFARFHPANSVACGGCIIYVLGTGKFAHIKYSRIYTLAFIRHKSSSIFVSLCIRKNIYLKHRESLLHLLNLFMFSPYCIGWCTLLRIRWWMCMIWDEMCGGFRILYNYMVFCNCTNEPLLWKRLIIFEINKNKYIFCWNVFRIDFASNNICN